MTYVIVLMNTYMHGYNNNTSSMDVVLLNIK